MILLIVSLIFAILVAIFAIQNANSVAVQFLWMVAEVPLVLVILGSVLTGAVIVLFIAIWREFHMKRKHKAQSMQSVVTSLPSLPAEPPYPETENPKPPE